MLQLDKRKKTVKIAHFYTDLMYRENFQRKNKASNFYFKLEMQNR